jgi:hypothetical protein
LQRRSWFRRQADEAEGKKLRENRALTPVLRKDFTETVL